MLACSRGETVLPPELTAGLVSEIRVRRSSDAPALTDREREILGMIASGKSLPEIARELYLGVTTVKTHVQHLYREARGLRPRRRRGGGDAPPSDRMTRPCGSVSGPDQPRSCPPRSRRWSSGSLGCDCSAIPLIVAAETCRHPGEDRDSFYVAVAVVSVYAVAMLVWVYTRPVTPAFAIAGTAVDVAAITALVCSPAAPTRRRA